MQFHKTEKEREDILKRSLKLICEHIVDDKEQSKQSIGFMNGIICDLLNKKIKERIDAMLDVHFDSLVELAKDTIRLNQFGAKEIEKWFGGKTIKEVEEEMLKENSIASVKPSVVSAKDSLKSIN